MSGRTIALEGGVGAGKTTLASMLAASLGGFVVPEYMDLAGLADPARIAAQLPSARFLYFLSLERLRTDVLVTHQPKPALLDRSFFSICAFEYAQQQIGLPSAFAAIPDLLRSAPETVIVPDSIYWLEVSDLGRQTRVAGRNRAVLSVLVNLRFNDEIAAFFAALAKFHYVVSIPTDGLTVISVMDLIIKDVDRRPCGAAIDLAKLVSGLWESLR